MSLRKARNGRPNLSLGFLFPGRPLEQTMRSRRTLFESLEARCVLATFTPTTTSDFLIPSRDDVNLTTGAITDGPFAGAITLRSAVIASNMSAGADVINLPAGIYTLTQGTADDDAADGAVEVTGDLDVLSSILGLGFDNNDLTINGAAAATTIIEAGTTSSNGIDRIFDVDPPFGGGSLDFTVQNVTLRNGRALAPSGAGGDGGAIRFLGSEFVPMFTPGVLTITNSVLSNNTATAGPGGAINSSFATMVFDGVQFQNNTALVGAGGAVLFDGGTMGSLTVDNSQFVSNTATDATFGSGGALFITGATSAQLGNTTANTFTGNSAAVDGGAVRIQATTTTTVNGGQFTSNSAGGNGGGISSDPSDGSVTGTVTLTGVTFGLNQADSDANSAGDGGAVFHDRGTLNLNSVIIGGVAGANSAWNGGGLAHRFVGMGVANDSTVTLSGGSIIGNTAINDGGGIYHDGTNGDTASTLNVGLTTGLAITNNAARRNGGALANVGAGASGAVADLSHLTLTGNQANSDNAGGGDGGAIFHSGAGLTIDFSRITGNTALTGGGGTGTTGIRNGAAGGVSAENNWWGADANPGTGGTDTISTSGGAIDADPRLDLTLTSTPSSVRINQSSSLVADFTVNSAGTPLLLTDLVVLIGLPITFATNLGSVTGAELTIQADGQATATFNAGPTTGTATVTAQVDNVPAAATNITVFSLADLQITKTDGSATEVPGTTVTYTIVVTNAGPDAASSVPVTDTFPVLLSGVTYTSVVSGGATNNTAAGSGNIADTLNLPANSTVTYTVTGTIDPAATGNLSNTASVGVPAGVVDNTPANNSATDTDTLTPQADLAVTKTNGQATLTPGTPVAYTIVVSNAGPSNVIGASVSDMFPADLTGVSYTASATGGATNFTASGSGSIADTVNMPAGSTITYIVSATVSLAATGTVSNTATVTAPGGMTDTNPGNNSATDSDPVALAVDLSVTKTDGLATATPGTSVTYTIVVVNNGPNAVTNATVSDTFPAALMGVTWTSTATTGASGNSTNGAGAINEALTMTVGSSVTYLVTGTISASATGTLSNTATVAVGAGFIDLSPGNNSATDTDTLTASADLQLTKSNMPTTVLPGGMIAYTLQYTDAGPSDAQAVSIADAVPVNTTFVSASAPAGWSISTPAVGGTGPITFTKPTVASGETGSMTIVVSVNSSTPNGTLIVNTAAISSASGDPSSANNTSGTTTTVQSLDFGDAPNSYGTVLASNGPRHTVGALYLGGSVDAELDGQPNPTATGDDTAGVDDENGVAPPGSFIARVDASITVNASAAGKLDAWIDYNRNGVFEASERIASSLAVAAGANTLVVHVPATASAGSSFARFRLSSAGGLGPTGAAADGEVEDYAVQLATAGSGPSAVVVPDPLNPGQGLLLVNGTANSDAIIVEPVPGAPSQIRVIFPGLILGPFAANSFQRIVVFGGSGSDAIVINAAITKPSYIYGDDGNDSVVSGSGDDFIFGGAGIDSLAGGAGHDAILGEQDSDYLYGGVGNDLLIGGGGQDWLYGQEDDDILIGSNGPTASATLAAIMAIWKSPAPFNARVTSLSGLLNASTVSDDGVVDYLLGSVGRDWQLDFQNRDSFLDFTFLDDRKN